MTLQSKNAIDVNYQMLCIARASYINSTHSIDEYFFDMGEALKEVLHPLLCLTSIFG